jgi:hypothetical protein
MSTFQAKERKPSPVASSSHLRNESRKSALRSIKSATLAVKKSSVENAAPSLLKMLFTSPWLV